MESVRQDSEFQSRVSRATELLDHLITEHEVYHSHKETMAHSGLVVMLGLTAGLLSLEEWPPVWMPCVPISAKFVANSLLLSAWLLLHIYVRWQLLNRRAAALIQAGAFRALCEWTTRSPIMADLRAGPSETADTHEGSFLRTFIDHWVWPLGSAAPPYDNDLSHHPRWLADSLVAQAREGTGAVFAERLVTVASFASLVALSLRALS